jgi:curli production assembly/transport component CsgG/holdfast attachment protein HfaB
MARSILIKSPTKNRSALRGIALSFGALALAGCISPVAGPSGTYAAPIGNAPVISNETPYSTALRCMSRQVRGRGIAGPRIAVGQIADYTGKEEFEGGRKVTQGAALMAISALAKAGVRLVERFDTGVSELELKYANNKLIGDTAEQGAYRQVHAGQIPGSDFYLVGGITELNFNIRSGGLDGLFSEESATGTTATLVAKQYVLNVGLDLRLVKTSTLEVVDVISYQKQIIGRELRAGVFDFLGGNLIDIGAGEKALEPIQLAVRSVIERAVLEMIGSLNGLGPSTCAGNDPLGDGRGMATNRYVNELNGSTTAVKVPHATQGHTTQTYAAAPQTRPQAQAPVYYNTQPTAAPQQAPYTAPATSGGYDHATRNRPYGWYAGSNGSVDSGLRGSL